MICGFQTGGPPLGPASQCRALPSPPGVLWGAYTPAVRATVASRPCSWRRHVPLLASHTDGQARAEEMRLREVQRREVQRREAMTPLQIQQMWLEVMGRSLSNTESTLVADDPATVEESEVDLDEEGEWDEDEEEEEKEEEVDASLGVVAVAPPRLPYTGPIPIAPPLSSKALAALRSSNLTALRWDPRSENSYGVIYREQMRRRMEWLQLTEPGRVDLTSSSLSSSDSSAPDSSEVGDQSRRERRREMGFYEEGEDPVRNFVLGRPWVQWEAPALTLVQSLNSSTWATSRLLPLLRTGNGTALGCIRVTYHLRSGFLDVAEVPLLERTRGFQKLPSGVQWLVQWARPAYAPVHFCKRLCLLRLGVVRMARLCRAVALSRPYFFKSYAKGWYLVLLAVSIAVLMDQGLYRGMSLLLSMLTGGKYHLPRLGVTDRLCIGTDIMSLTTPMG